MFYLLSETLLHGRRYRHTITASQTPQLCLLNLLISSKPISTKANQHSTVVSYLINSCGLSPKSALSASKKVVFETPKNPNLVLGIFKYHGFSQTQISKIIEKLPKLLVCKPDKTLLAKFEFFHSLGISGSDLATLICTSPYILSLGLNSNIAPKFIALEELLKSKDKATASIKRMPSLFHCKIESIIAALRGHGVPDANIARLIQRWPQYTRSNGFEQTIEIVKKMGISPIKINFIIAIVALNSNRKTLWNRKVNLYKSWGWSEEQIIAAFANYPWCMVTSEGKISSNMDFFLNKMGLEASDVADYPYLIAFSLEKRLFPRASVIQFMLSKGLLGQKISTVAQLFRTSEKIFMRRCLTILKDQPEILKLYKEKLDISPLREGSV